jgi:primosomal protein N' (replication factor Y)
MPVFVDVAFPIGLDQVFTYSVPQDLESSVGIGVRVLAPLGARKAIGVVVNVPRSSPLSRLKMIDEIIDTRPVVAEDLLRLTRWIAEYYVAPWGEALKTALPPGLGRKPKLKIGVTSSVTKDTLTHLPRKQAEVLSLLLTKGSLTRSQIEKHLRSKNTRGLLHGLSTSGYILITEHIPTGKTKVEKVIRVSDEIRRRLLQWKHSSSPTERQIKLIDGIAGLPDGIYQLHHLLRTIGVSLSTLSALAAKHVVSIDRREVVRSPIYEPYGAALGQQNITLTASQRTAVERISAAVHDGSFRTFLLHGVTGSGKTQVYIEAIRQILDKGKSAIVLVPEISLTPQIVRRFNHHFATNVTVLHSRMSAAERYDSWRLTREGRYSIVIGPRSAVFAPVRNLGLIVVDEEQESSYKQFDQTPRYHARDVAIVRAQHAKAIVVLGSATPSVESYFNALRGKYTLIDLPMRVDNATLPRIEVVDMTAERKKHLERFRTERRQEFKIDPVAARLNRRRLEMNTISDLLASKIDDRLRKGEGIILLQNRRGFSAYVECADCGFVEMCDNCNVTLTFHSVKRQLRCHYCGFVKTPPSTCPACQGRDFLYLGIGTQRVEDDLRKQFPQARVVRMDLDTTTRKHSHDIILRKFAEGEFDILLGTQMVAKGLDFSRVTLVGVVSADTQMLLPDFRSAERVFQLLTQVAGRAGRSGALKGEVVVQTSQPHHYGLKHVVAHDFAGFYREELKFRQDLDYPPFSRVVLIELKGERETEVIGHAERLADLLKTKNSHFIILGPSPAAIPKLKGLFRWHMFIKNLKSVDPAGCHLHDHLVKMLHAYRNSVVGKSRRVRVSVDVDPVGLL